VSVNASIDLSMAVVAFIPQADGSQAEDSWRTGYGAIPELVGNFTSDAIAPGDPVVLEAANVHYHNRFEIEAFSSAEIALGALSTVFSTENMAIVKWMLIRLRDPEEDEHVIVDDSIRAVVVRRDGNGKGL
jgi:hypothetical protein